MKLIVNGKDRIVKNNIFLSSLIEEFNLNSDKIIVQIDSEIIPQIQFESLNLKENSNVEILAIVGGG